MTINPSLILARKDITLERTPDELCTWVDQKLKLFGTSRQTKEYARLGRGLSKQFFEEVLPLSLFARHLFGGRSDVHCRPNLGNQNFDAVILDRSTTRERELFIEFTYAKDGYDESLRMKVLAESGHVSLLGKVKVTGTRAKGRKIEVDNEAVRHDVVRAKNLCLIKERAQQKAKKKYGPQHVLVVVFDDYIGIRNEDTPILKEFVELAVISPKLDFKTFYLLGVSGKTLIPFSLPRYKR